MSVGYDEGREGDNHLPWLENRLLPFLLIVLAGALVLVIQFGTVIATFGGYGAVLAIAGLLAAVLVLVIARI